ncbi:MAG: restriction endonuclease subunit S [Chloroflexi bacterium]|nr:restriction endonuclease subunit S [Chloroflexota bacterium]
MPTFLEIEHQRFEFSNNNFSNLLPNPNWATLPLFDRSGWQRVRFGDVVENCNETCDPAEAGLERFIAMEHLEPGSLHVRAWGNVADGTTFTRRCQPGQVLFGKRRAYQRKVAVAEFEAVVSGDIYVLAPKDAQRLLPDLLPFICLSERFFQHAVGTSAGSLSPRTNWSSLASFEFDLPPLDQQRRIAEILWAVDEVLNENLVLLSTSKSASTTYIDSFLSNAITMYKTVTLGELIIGKQKYGANAPAVTLRQGMPRYIRITDIDDQGQLIYDEAMGVELDATIIKSYTLNDGDILIARTGNTVGKSFLYYSSNGPCVYAGYLIRFQPDKKKILPEYLFAVTKSSYYRSWLENTIRVGAQPNVNGAEYASMPVPLHPLDSQKHHLAELANLSAIIKNSEANLSAIRHINTLILNSIF